MKEPEKRRDAEHAEHNEERMHECVCVCYVVNFQEM